MSESDTFGSLPSLTRYFFFPLSPSCSSFANVEWKRIINGKQEVGFAGCYCATLWKHGWIKKSSLWKEKEFESGSILRGSVENHWEFSVNDTNLVVAPYIYRTCGGAAKQQPARCRARARSCVRAMYRSWAQTHKCSRVVTVWCILYGGDVARK